MSLIEGYLFTHEEIKVQWVELELTVIICALGELGFETLTIWGQQELGIRWKPHVDLIILVAEYSIKM